MKLYVVMWLTIFKDTNNLCKHIFLMHLIYILCKICVVRCSYRSVNWIIFLTGIIGVIILIFMKLCVVMSQKILKILNKLFK
jgi:hypothetical protein